MKQFIMNYWWILMIAIAFLFIANTSISFKPFSVTMKSPFTAIGWFMVVFGIIFIVAEASIQAKHEGYMQGIEELSKDLQEAIKDGTLLKDSE